MGAAGIIPVKINVPNIATSRHVNGITSNKSKFISIDMP